jgi:hypothetical protein
VKETPFVVGVAQVVPPINITSYLRVAVVLTKQGTWHFFASRVTNVHIFSMKGKPFIRGNFSWSLMTQEHIQSWLSGNQDWIDVVEGATLEQWKTGACFGTRM